MQLRIKLSSAMQRFSALRITLISETARGNNQMIQNSEVLAGKANRVSLISAGGTTMQEGYPIVTEIQIPVDRTEQTWIFEVGKDARVSRTTPGLVDTLVKAIKWLNHLGSGKIDDSCLETRHNVHHNFRINGIGL